MFKVIVFALFLTIFAQSNTITFKSLDGLKITADLYVVDKNYSKPFILLFHQAGWSRGEYKEIAPKLNKLGFNVMAVDLRSGGEINGVVNQTHQEALFEEKSTSYLDSIQDIEASINYAKENYAKGKLIILGSSYSASLVIYVASKSSNLIDGVVAFSPGEYFKKYGKSNSFIKNSAKNLKVPIFIASANKEYKIWENIYKSIESKKSFFIPKSGGVHGSRNLWSRFKTSKQYWSAVEKFLKEYK